ncbi:MAG TPA: YdeI/OmpD-associated family protein [Stellaceae bacterium]|nr:YdeI/OmpD-associated family protein [Stellaceae bacterium]
MNPKVDAHLDKAKKWQNEMRALRTIVLNSGLAEEFKWHQPCYTFEGGIVLLIGSFKEYCCLAFFKGSLLKDPNSILVAPGEYSQAVRQARLTSVPQIAEMEPVLKTYIQEAIEIEKAGLKVQKSPKVEVPEEFQSNLDTNPALKTAFESLTPGRRRAYLMHFSQPKQSKTREARIERCLPQILAGKGLDDDYRSMRK